MSEFFFFFQCVLVTYGVIAGLALFYKLKPKKQAAVTEK